MTNLLTLEFDYKKPPPIQHQGNLRSLIDPDSSIECSPPNARMFPGMFGPIGLFQQAPWMDPAAYMAAAPHWDYLLRSVNSNST